MIKLHDDIFFGIYSYLLKVEGGAKKEVSSYFAYSTLFALISLQALVLASLILVSGGFYISDQDKLTYGLLIVFFLFSVNWLIFLRRRRYSKIISKYFKENMARQNLAKNRTIIFMSVVFVQFMVMVAIKIIQFS